MNGDILGLNTVNTLGQRNEHNGSRYEMGVRDAFDDHQITSDANSPLGHQAEVAKITGSPTPINKR
jgi:hypothetical protein